MIGRKEMEREARQRDVRQREGREREAGEVGVEEQPVSWDSFKPLTIRAILSYIPI